MAPSKTPRNAFESIPARGARAAEPFFDTLRQLPAYDGLIAALRGSHRVDALGLPRAARLAVLAALQQGTGSQVLLVTDREDHSQVLAEELDFWTDASRIRCPEPSSLYYEREPWSSNVRVDRLRALVSMLGESTPGLHGLRNPAIIIASARALMTRTIPPREFLGACRQLSADSRLPANLPPAELIRLGYERSNVVTEPGQFAVRGGILDLWVPSERMPARLELVGDTIESIRSFDPSTQVTVGHLKRITIVPAREFLAPLAAPGGRPHHDRVRSESDIPELHPSSATLLDYVPPGGLVVLDDLMALEGAMQEIEGKAVELREAAIDEGLLLSGAPLPYATWSELSDQLSTMRCLTLGRAEEPEISDNADATTLAQSFRHDERFGGRIKPLMEYVQTLIGRGDRVLVTSRQRPRLEELWNETASLDDPPLEPGHPSLVFADVSLREGFALGSFHLLTDAEIFGWERPASRWRARQAVESPEARYSDLRPGDYVVHVDHGIARYAGLVRRMLDGREREYLELTYDSRGKLFVPVHQADRLTRFVGAEGSQPTLDRLGGHDWNDRKTQAAVSVARVAKEMLELHARRQLSKGFAFQADSAWQAELEASFPYAETQDQIRALQEIKQDMERERPMDRLLCGDVGYGKTELALRVAFKAVVSGKQVAMLVPTTVLAQQHWETFRQRLAGFPVSVDALSRFRSPREQAEILAALRGGRLDIVVGTHRLLSADVEFKDLGLVIIDEEQRFGVSHKEHLKRLRTEVDVLTLTATPIPRTLYMALTGVRDISNLNTAPEERLPVVTHVGPYSPRLVRHAIVRELERGGQVFFVHNRVSTIHAMHAHLTHLVPEARVEVGHGQMPEHELESVMGRFNHGLTDVLLSTTIIESGLDIPNANTLIVDRADAFGLAQLYQLRGRVGRGAMRGYAYFFRHRRRETTIDAQQRLDVIAENTELGAGYSIAMRDLEIRGAGELLGSQQHGHIQSVGFHLYTRLLADAVRSIRHKEPGDASLAPPEDGPSDSALLAEGRYLGLPVTVELPLAAGIPTDYVADKDLRLRLYRRIADLQDEAEIEALSGEFEDRFGALPRMVHDLFLQARIKLRAESAGLSSVSWEAGQLVLRFARGRNGHDAGRLPDLGPGIRGGKGAYWCTFRKGQEWKDEVLEVLDTVRAQFGRAVPKEPMAASIR